MGVEIFFVISAVLLYRPFARRHLDGVAPPGLGTYTVRRALRIYPAYWVALLRYIGCTGHAHEVATVFGDEIAIRAQTLIHDAANPAEVMGDVVAAQSARIDSNWAAPHLPRAVR